MATTIESDILMGGTIESLNSYIYSNLRSDIILKLKRQLPPNWPRQFYETPFLFFFASSFRRVCRFHDLRDRSAAMEKLEPLFSQIEGALKATASDLSQRRRGENRVEALEKERAALLCQEKIQDIDSTKKAIKTGKADKYLTEREQMKQKWFLTSGSGVPDAKLQSHVVKTNTARPDQTDALATKQTHKASPAKSPSPEVQVKHSPPALRHQDNAERKENTQQTHQESQAICRSPEVQLKHSPQASRPQDNAEEKGKPHDPFLPAILRLSTGTPSLQRNQKQRLPGPRYQPGLTTVNTDYKPKQKSPLRKKVRFAD